MRKIPYAGRVFDETEKKYAHAAVEDFWLTAGRWTCRFEEGMADYLGIPYTFFVNSGSSANLLAFMSLTSHKLKDRRIKRGDEVITTACCFPTTVAPILQFGAVPVFVDVNINGNIDIDMLRSALSEKTKAIMVAHTLGNPFNVKVVKEFCIKNNLWLIEDNCDALGAKYDGKFTATWGDIGTLSFYPAHHITTGEGGMVVTSNQQLATIIQSIRDWGRDCTCKSGVDNSCNCRFEGTHGLLPYGYDHKYVYSHLGYNLKATDLQAAIGCAQLEKLPDFVQKRKDNWEYLNLNLNLEKYYDLLVFPYVDPQSEPSWFGFMIHVLDNGYFDRNDIVEHLENEGIQTRMLFAGNILLHPCMQEFVLDKDYRKVGNLSATNALLDNSFWIGVYPGLKHDDLEYMANTIRSFIDGRY